MEETTLTEHEQRLETLKKELDDIDKIIDDATEKFKTLNKEKEKLEYILKIKKQFEQYKHLENFNTLNEDEFGIIFCNKKRIWYGIEPSIKCVELEDLLKSAIELKKRFGDVVLTKINTQGIINCKNQSSYSYSFVFKFSDGSKMEYYISQI